MTPSNRPRPADVKPPSVAALIGAAKRDITPPVGIYARQWGAASHDVAEGVHRPLTANVMVLRRSPTAPPFVLATFDGGWWQDLDDERRVREALLSAHHLDPSRVLIALSHTHAACALCAADADKPGGHLIEPYLRTLARALIEATEVALTEAQPATLDWTYGHCHLAANRDLPDPDADRTVCGFNPDAPADDTLLVGRATSEDGTILGAVVNYACHATTLAWENKLISPDYVGAMRETVEAATGGAPVLFLQGASGELGPREGFTGDTAVADANGRDLGCCVISALASMLPARTALTYDAVVESGAPLATWKRVPYEPATHLAAESLDVELPLKPLPPPEEIERQLAECTDRVQGERLKRKLRLLRKVGAGPTVHVPTWFWRLGDAVLVAHPNETYSLLQRTLRQRYPEVAMPVVTVVNGGMGYLSPAELHDTDIYQVWASPFARGAMDALITACDAQIARMLEPA